jgi:hypothetical protein
VNGRCTSIATELFSTTLALLDEGLVCLGVASPATYDYPNKDHEKEDDCVSSQDGSIGRWGRNLQINDPGRKTCT